VLVEFNTSMWPETLGEELMEEGWDVVSVGRLMADRNKVLRSFNSRNRR
jgi:hypothetical protein